MFGIFSTVNPTTAALASISNTSSGTVRGSGTDLGGFVGHAAMKVSFNTDTATGDVITSQSGVTHLGGFAGRVSENVEITKCRSSGSISEGNASFSANYVGGFIGNLTTTAGGALISKSWTRSNITLGNASASTLGGFVGMVSGSHSISQSYVADTSIYSAGTGGNNEIGGFVGTVLAGSALNLSAVYTATLLTAASGNVKGFEGSNSGTLTIADSYYIHSGTTPQNAITGLSQLSSAQAGNAANAFYSPANWDNQFSMNSAWVAPNSLGINPCGTAGCPHPYYTLPVLIYP